MRAVFCTNCLLDQFFKYFSAEVSLKKDAMHNTVFELKKTYLRDYSDIRIIKHLRVLVTSRWNVQPAPLTFRVAFEICNKNPIYQYKYKVIYRETEFTPSDHQTYICTVDSGYTIESQTVNRATTEKNQLYSKSK